MGESPIESSIEYLYATVESAIAYLTEMNAPNEPTRSRELSIALTNLETGLLWLNAAIENAKIEQEI